MSGLYFPVKAPCVPLRTHLVCPYNPLSSSHVGVSFRQHDGTAKCICSACEVLTKTWYELLMMVCLPLIRRNNFLTSLPEEMEALTSLRIINLSFNR